MLYMSSTTTPSSPVQPDPNVTVGTRKHRQTQWAIKGDPLARKKIKRLPKATVEDAGTPRTPPCGQPLRQDSSQSLGATDHTDNDRESDAPGGEVIDVDDTKSDEEEVFEDDNAELCGYWMHLSFDLSTQTVIDRLHKDWDAPIYVFLNPLPSIEYVHKQKSHVFKCSTSQCHYQTRFVHWYLDKSDVKSTSNLHCHAKACWGNEVVVAADTTQDVNAAQDALANHKEIDGSIKAIFQHIGKGGATYSHRQFTRTEARYTSTLKNKKVASNSLQGCICVLGLGKQPAISDR
jgi:hypothetical protein